MLSAVCVVIHPNRLAREGLKAILANSPFNPVWTSSSIEQVPSSIASTGEQLLVLIGVREAAKLAQTLSAARAIFPDASVVVMGDACDGDVVITALGAGATTFLDDRISPSTLIKELELVAQGEPVISVLLIKRLLGQGPAQAPEVAARTSEQAGAPITLDQRQPRKPDDEDEVEDEDGAASNTHLSSRETAILNDLVQGTPNKVIAKRLNITEATVKVHVKAILRKIGVQNRTQAAIWGLRRQQDIQHGSVHSE